VKVVAVRGGGGFLRTDLRLAELLIVFHNECVKNRIVFMTRMTCVTNTVIINATGGRWLSCSACSLTLESRGSQYAGSRLEGGSRQDKKFLGIRKLA
jgi:hypothetical protein